MNAKLNRGTCARVARKNKKTETEKDRGRKGAKERGRATSNFASLNLDRYPEYALREEIIAGAERTLRECRRAGNPLVYVSKSSGPRGCRHNVTREIRVPPPRIFQEEDKVRRMRQETETKTIG